MEVGGRSDFSSSLYFPFSPPNLPLEFASIVSELGELWTSFTAHGHGQTGLLQIKQDYCRISAALDL